MFVIIVGSGRLAVGLASSLSARKDDVVIVDRGLESSKLGPGFDGIAVDGDPMDMEVLRGAGTERCDLFVAVTGDDNVNAACVQAAKVLFKAPKVLARIADPSRESFYSKLGVTTVCPTSTGINEVLDLMATDRLEPLELSLDPGFACVRPRRDWIGHKANAISVAGGAKVVGLVRRGMLTKLSSDDLVREGDSVVVEMRSEHGVRRLWSA